MAGHRFSKRINRFSFLLLRTFLIVAVMLAATQIFYGIKPAFATGTMIIVAPSGGAGTDTATDFTPGQGDTQDGTIP